MALAELFKKHTWSTVWILIRRAPRDRCARTALLRFIVALAFLTGYVAYCGLLVRRFLFDVFELLLLGSLIAGALFFFVARKWTERYDLIQLNKNLPPPVAPDIKDGVLRETRLLAAMLERAGSERAMEKGVEPGIEVITRRVLLEKLRKHGLVSSLQIPYLDLLNPDGTWTEEQKSSVQSCWEFLVVLRWVLGTDSALRPIWLNPEYHVRMASGVLDRTEWASLRMLPPWEMRIERDRASNFFTRCHIELIARDALPNADEEAKAEAKMIKAEIDERPSGEDFLLGSSTISELELPELRNCALRSYRRWQILELLVEASGGDKPAQALNSLLREHLTPATETESNASSINSSNEGGV